MHMYGASCNGGGALLSQRAVLTRSAEVEHLSSIGLLGHLLCSAPTGTRNPVAGQIYVGQIYLELALAEHSPVGFVRHSRHEFSASIGELLAHRSTAIGTVSDGLGYLF